MDYFAEYDLYEFPEYQKQKPKRHSMKQVEDWLQDRIDRDAKLLNERTSPILTDSGIDVTESIRTRLSTYIEVKSYLERGNMGQ
jgi:hypothetical protein